MPVKTIQEKYKDACVSVGQAPKSYIVSDLSNYILHIRLEKVLSDEWKPILMCVEKNSNLVEIKTELSPTSWGVNAQNRFRKNFPPSIKLQLFKSLVSCMTCSSALLKLSIINVPLKKVHLELLSTGIARNNSLKTLSLKGSLNGHKSLSILLPCIKRSINLNWIDFSSCKLNPESCELICSLLRSQILERHTETWRQTLRYNNPDVNAVSGIKRISLNGNNISDEGAEAISVALQDDFWLKALDLQQCGITNEGAKALLLMLEDSPSICVLDLRLNGTIDSHILTKIEAITKDNITSDSNGISYLPLFTNDKVTRPKKPIKKSISNLNMRNTLNESKMNLNQKKPSNYEKYYNTLLRDSIVKNQESLNDIQLLDDKSKFSPILVHPKTVKDDKGSRPSKSNGDEEKIYKLLDDLQSDIKIYKEELNQEKERTRRLESRISELERENLYLQQQQSQQQNEIEPELLETIESSFNQFHNFLDLLKQAGYSELCKLVDKS